MFGFVRTVLLSTTSPRSFWSAGLVLYVGRRTNGASLHTQSMSIIFDISHVQKIIAVRLRPAHPAFFYIIALPSCIPLFLATRVVTEGVLWGHRK